MSETTPDAAPRGPSRLRRTLQWRFWVNLAVVLAVTCWIPLLTQTAVMKDQEGTILNQTTIQVRAWRSWVALVTQGPSLAHGKAVGLHFGLSFLMCFTVWYLAAGRDLRAEQTPQDTPQEETPHE